jgi:hypothetical protein
MAAATAEGQNFFRDVVVIAPYPETGYRIPLGQDATQPIQRMQSSVRPRPRPLGVEASSPFMPLRASSAELDREGIRLVGTIQT